MTWERSNARLHLCYSPDYDEFDSLEIITDDRAISHWSEDEDEDGQLTPRLGSYSTSFVYIAQEEKASSAYCSKVKQAREVRCHEGENVSFVK